MIKVESPVFNKQQILEKAIKLITKFEGFNPVCKWDNKQYSWGYGTKCYKAGSKTTMNNALKEKTKHIEGNYNRIMSLNDKLTSNQIIGLISFYYNTGNYNDTSSYVKRGDIKSVKYIMNKYIMKGTRFEAGLKKRRKAEIEAMEGIYN